MKKSVVKKILVETLMIFGQKLRVDSPVDNPRVDGQVIFEGNLPNKD